MDWTLIDKILTDGSVVVAGFLAIDNVLDGMFKAFGYTHGDTICAKIAALLNKVEGEVTTITKVIPATPTAPAQTTTTTTVTPIQPTITGGTS